MSTSKTVVHDDKLLIPSALQLFPAALPSELLCNIFAHLSQSDCYECILVCKLWFQLVPQYATQVWRTLVLRSATSRQRIAHFIGRHVKEVRLHSYHECKVLADLAWLQPYGATQVSTLCK